MFFFSFIEHLFIINDFFGDISQLTDVFLHLFFVKFLHLSEISIGLIDALDFYVLHSVIHELVDLF